MKLFPNTGISSSCAVACPGNTIAGRELNSPLVITLTLFKGGPPFFSLSAIGKGGVPRYNFKPLLVRPPKLRRIMYWSFPTSRHNLIDTTINLIDL